MTDGAHLDSDSQETERAPKFCFGGNLRWDKQRSGGTHEVRK
jgi:hypothetical protein